MVLYSVATRLISITNKNSQVVWYPALSCSKDKNLNVWSLTGHGCKWGHTPSVKNVVFCITNPTTLSVAFTFSDLKSLEHPVRTPAIFGSSPSPWLRATFLWSWMNRQLRGSVEQNTYDTPIYLYFCCVIYHTFLSACFSFQSRTTHYGYAGKTNVWLLFDGTISVLLSNSRAAGYIQCT